MWDKSILLEKHIKLYIYFFPLKVPAGFAALCEFYPVGARAAMPL